jgi:hypothetical protein
MSPVTTVRVEFINAATGEPLGEAELPSAQLPETFAKPTTLHLPDGDWQVEHAEPVTAEEFAASGRLRITMRKIEMVDPSKLLYSLPTIESAPPPMRGGGDDDSFRMHEDDWRQIEIIAARFDGEVAAEFEAIRAVHAEAKGAAFPRCHVRERIPRPLGGARLRLADVADAFGAPAVRALSFHDYAGVVDGGFAFRAGDAVVYGREEKGALAVLGLAGGVESAPLLTLARAHSLVLVDWCGTNMLRPGHESFGA